MKRFSFRSEAVRDDHPAILAWQSLGGASPESIDSLASANGTPWKKSAIYRLNGVGILGSAVVAKRSRRSTMLVERNVYQRILPSLRLPSLHYYGFVDEEESDLSWLFIEAADGMPFSAESHLHRRKAAEWLGGMHTATAQQELRSFLPSYELDDHLRDVNFARKNILQSRLNPALSKSEFLILDATLAHCDWLESRRGELQDFSARMPRCLVHGDFDNKNVRVRTQDGSFVLEIMDWETASWSFPAVDIATIDLSTYFRIVQPYWPNLTIEAVRDLAAIGSIFINMGFIAATSPELIQEWAPYTVQDIAIFEQILTNSRRALGWG